MVTGKLIEIDEGEQSTYFGYCCKFNEGVGCHPLKHQCGTCGWNPKVAKERLIKRCKELGLKPPPGLMEG